MEKVGGLVQEEWSAEPWRRWVVRVGVHVLLWLFVCVAAAWVFGFTFWFPQSFEDYFINDKLGYSTLRDVLAGYGKVESLFALFFRPTAELIQWIFNRAFGTSDFSQHLIQYVFTCISTGFLYWLVYRLSRSKMVSGWCAGCFLVSGVQMNYYLVASTYTFDRLMLLFVLLALVVSLTRAWIIVPFSLFCALTSKETAVVFPGLLGAWWVANLMVAPRPVRWRPTRRIVLCSIAVAVVYGGYLLWRSVILNGEPPSHTARYTLVLDWNIFLRNLEIVSGYLLEPFIAFTLPGGSFEVYPERPGKMWWLVLPVAAVVICVLVFAVAIIRRRQSVPRIAATLFFGGCVLLLTMLPLGLIEEDYRLSLYLAYLPSAGAAIIYGTLIGVVARFMAGSRFWSRVTMNVVLVCLVAWYVKTWIPGTVLAKSWYRAHLEMGAGSRDHLLQSLGQTIPDLKRMDVFVAGTTNAQRKALELKHLFQEKIDAPASIAYVHTLKTAGTDMKSFVEHSHLTSLGIMPLTDRFGVIVATNSGGEPFAGEGLLNGEFTADAMYLGEWRPLGWVPARLDKDFHFDKLQNGGEGLRLSRVEPGMEDGVRQSMLLRPGRYELKLNARRSSGGSIGIDVRRDNPRDVLHRFDLVNEGKFRHYKLQFDVEELEAYSIVVGVPGGKANGLELGEVTLVRVGESQGVAVEHKVVSPNLLPPLAQIFPEQPGTTGTVEFVDDSTTGFKEWPTGYIDLEPLPHLTRYRLAVDGRSSSTAIVQALITPQFDDPDSYQDGEPFVVHLDLAKDFTTASASFILPPYCKRLRIDLAPGPIDQGEASVGSVLLRSAELNMVDMPQPRNVEYYVTR